ncbi:hypothetical protein GCM10009804_58380 [Kribbella hippodromi]|uniref:Uncharacterized protein n=1 Tax=Kribbella hippodromi TaxID=434347 RepID=A0ABN2E2B0_9ACTN
MASTTQPIRISAKSSSARPVIVVKVATAAVAPPGPSMPVAVSLFHYRRAADGDMFLAYLVSFETIWSEAESPRSVWP